MSKDKDGLGNTAGDEPEPNNSQQHRKTSPEDRRKAFTLLQPENTAVLTSPQAFFETIIQDLMAEAAAIIFGGRNETEDPLYVEVPGEVDYFELIRILKERSIPVPVASQRNPFAIVENIRERERWIVDKITVKVVVYYRGWIVVVKPAREADMFAQGEEYFFDAREVLKTSDKDNGFKGKNFWEVEEILKQKQLKAISQRRREDPENKECTIFDRIIRVRTLIQSLLYDLEIIEKERIVLAKELIALKLEIGAAAVAVIQDFILEFTRGNGWMSAISHKHNNGSVMDGDIVYDRTLAERLIAGEFDLRNLVL